MGPLLITATAVRMLIDSNSTEFARFQQDAAVKQPSRDRQLYRCRMGNGAGARTGRRDRSGRPPLHQPVWPCESSAAQSHRPNPMILAVVLETRRPCAARLVRYAPRQPRAWAMRHHACRSIVRLTSKRRHWTRKARNYAALSSRHSARAAARFSLKFSRL